MKSSRPSPVYAPPAAVPKLNAPRAVSVSMKMSLRRIIVTPVLRECLPLLIERLSANCQICPPLGFQGAPVRSAGKPSAEEDWEMPKFGGPHSSGLLVKGSWSASPICFVTSVVKLVSSSSNVRLLFQPARASLNMLDENT